VTSTPRDERAIATLRVDRLRDALTVAGLAGLSDQSIIAYLAAQRWFGAKGERPASARVIDVVPLPWDEDALGIAIVEVGSPNGNSLYQMPLAVRAVDATKVAAADPGAIVARVIAADGEASLLDAVRDPVFQRQLGAAFIAPKSFDSPSGGRWVIERVSKAALVFRPDAEIVVGSAEQSNSALIFDNQAFLKLFRKIETGVQPDVEMTRFLTVDAAFPHVPGLFGTISYRHRGGDAIAGMLQEYLPGSRDAWAYVLDRIHSGQSPKAVTAEIERLGVVTRELHDALAGPAAAKMPDFTPMHAAAGDVERWAQRTKETVREATTLLYRQRSAGKLAAPRAVEAEILVRRRDHYLTWIEEVADLIGDDGGAKIRIHGDYHLGQVLRTKSDSFVIIDFEGEPTRPLAERREKTSALRDVAGMLRSLAYAAATLVHDQPRGSTKDARTPAERELASGRWERDARSAFLRGYTGRMQDQRNLFPRDAKRFDALLSLFEAEKAFYELAYELNHRPGWEWIPMRGISRLLVK
jgi:trehalose synthase-fused probable maltokinase